MKIDFATINYNTYSHTENFIKSLIESFKFSSKDLNINIYIGDNGPDDQTELIKAFIEKIRHKVIFIDVKRLSNNGYFGTLNDLLTLNNLNNSDALILGNNDIIFKKDYILNLETLILSSEKFKDSFCFVPRVETENKFDDNPRFEKKYPLSKFFIQRISYSSFLIFQVINKIKKLKLIFKRIFIKNRLEPLNDKKVKRIFLPVGVQFIFINPPFSYRLPKKTFLYGEESFISMQALENYKYIYHYPKLHIFHSVSASVSFKSLYIRWKLLKQSFTINREFLRNESIK